MSDGASTSQEYRTGTPPIDVGLLIEDFEQVVKLAYSGITVDQLGVEEYERLARVYRALELLKETHGHH